MRRSSLLSRPDVALLWTAGLASALGGFIMMIALPVTVHRATGSEWATAVTVLAGVAPAVLVGQLAGVVADRVDRRRLFAASACAVGTLQLAFIAAAESPWWSFALLNAVVGLTGQFLGPAEHALFPELVEVDRLGEAGALNALNNNLARLVGPALGGVLQVHGGLGLAATFAAVGSMVAAVLVMLLPAERRVPMVVSARVSVMSAWLEGIRWVAQSRVLRGFVLILALMGLGEGFLGALLVPLADEVLGGGAQVIGWILSAQALGGLVGAGWAARNADRHDPVTVLGAAALCVAPVLALAFTYGLVWEATWPAVVLTGIAGIPLAVIGGAQVHALQLLSPEQGRARVFAAAVGVFGLAQLVGLLLAGAGGELVGPLLITVDAVAYLLAGVGALMLARSSRPGPTSA